MIKWIVCLRQGTAMICDGLFGNIPLNNGSAPWESKKF